jgi:predicted GTPase
MKIGAGIVAARRFGAAEIVDPRPYAVGKLAETYKIYPNIGTLLPAMGYDDQQMSDLSETIERTDCDSVVIATPIDLGRVIKINKPNTRVEYSLQEIGHPSMDDVLADFIKNIKG